MFALLKKGLGLFSSSPSRLLRFSLTNALRPYLKDEQQGKFEVQLWEGTVNIEDMQLNEKMINKKLSNLPFQIISASIGRLTMDVPWRRVATENVKVIIRDAVIIIALESSEQELDHEELEKSLESALQNSLMLSSTLHSSLNEEEEEEEDFQDASRQTEHLGIQSVEKLFEHIFSGLNIEAHNTIIRIRNQKSSTPEISFQVERLFFSNADENLSQKRLKKKPKKMIRISGIDLQIVEPPSQRGNILNLKPENIIFIDYGKDEEDNFKDVEIIADISEGAINGSISEKILQFLREFFSPLPSKEENPVLNMKPKIDKSVFSPIKEKLEKSPSFEEDFPEDLEQLEKSILSIAPYQKKVRFADSEEESRMMKLSLFISSSLWSLTNSSSSFILDLKELFLDFSLSASSTSLHFTLSQFDFS